MKKNRPPTILSKNPLASSIARKTVSDKEYGYKRRNNSMGPDVSSLHAVSGDTTSSIINADNIMQIHPETKLAMEILVSSILSPKDLMGSELTFINKSKSIDSDLAGKLIGIIKTHFTEDYPLLNKLQSILEDILFKKGSYPVMVIPESAVDDVINVGLEGILTEGEATDTLSKMQAAFATIADDNRLKASKGILGAGTSVDSSQLPGFSFESAGKALEFKETEINIPTLENSGLSGVYVSDNFELLKTPIINDVSRMLSMRNVLANSSSGLSLESKKQDAELKELSSLLFKDRSYVSSPYTRIKTSDQTPTDNVGDPLVMVLPPESIIPVFVPGSPSDHVGYYVLLDQTGNPVNTAKLQDQHTDLIRALHSNGADTLNSLAVTYSSQDSSNANQTLMADEATRRYGEIIEEDLTNRLKNGIYKNNVELGDASPIYRTMLTRALCQQATQVLYVPSELVTYFAFKFNEYGVGTSLIEDNKIIAGIRANLLFANTVGAIKNSGTTTKLSLELDPNDPEPDGTIEDIVNTYLQHTPVGLAMAEFNPANIVNRQQAAGVNVEISGHPNYPTTKFNVDEVSNNKITIDNDLDESLSRRYIMGFGLPPEAIDRSKEVEFAESIVSSNLFMAKRTMQDQDKFTPLLKDHMVKYVLNSANIINSMVRVIEVNKKSIDKKFFKNKAMVSGNKEISPILIIREFLKSLELQLPRPDSTKISSQKDAYGEYNDFLELGIDAYINEDSFDFGEVDDIEGMLVTTKAAITSYFQRKWLQDNNALPELLDLVMLNDTGTATLDLNEIHGNHITSMAESVAAFIKAQVKLRDKRDKKNNSSDEEDAGAENNPDDTADAPPEEEPKADAEEPLEEPLEEPPAEV